MLACFGCTILALKPVFGVVGVTCLAVGVPLWIIRRKRRKAGDVEPRGFDVIKK
jgi:hypothetical protein